MDHSFGLATVDGTDEFTACAWYELGGQGFDWATTVPSASTTVVADVKTRGLEPSLTTMTRDGHVGSGVSHFGRDERAVALDV